MAAKEPKEIFVVEDCNHEDLYDNVDKIPFDKLESFLRKYPLMIMTDVIFRKF